MYKQCFVIQIGIPVGDSGLCGLTNLLITVVWDDCAWGRFVTCLTPKRDTPLNETHAPKYIYINN